VSVRTCPVCAVLAQALFAFFAQWQYALATDHAVQRAFVAQHGLCPVHTWQYQEMASPQGICDGYAPLIGACTVELARLAEHEAGHAATALLALLADSTTCAVCRLVREVVSEQIKNLLAQLVTAKGRETYTSSAGLCLPHLQVALAQLEDGSGEVTERQMLPAFLLTEQVRRLENLAEDLRSYALKRDVLRRGLLNQEETNAWRRALVQLVGEKAARGGTAIADQATV
jgi:hypothetical protein